MTKTQHCLLCYILWYIEKDINKNQQIELT